MAAAAIVVISFVADSLRGPAISASSTIAASSNETMVSASSSATSLAGPQLDCPEQQPRTACVGKRLELLHITKTGGSSLEELAATHNVSWGACHFLQRIGSMPRGEFCPPKEPGSKKKVVVKKGIPLWHAPPKYVPSKDLWWLEDSCLFTVVRDPYERTVSAYNYHFRRIKDAWRRENATEMNAFLEESLKRIGDSRLHNDTDYLEAIAAFRILAPQVEYIDETVRVLRLESLREDFLCMLRDHGIDWDWPRRDQRNKSKPNALTVANLTESNLRLIEKVYDQDFEQLGYPHLHPE